MNPLFSCQNLSKSFGSRKLFQNLSLSVFPKDRVGLIGPNGSGKSTLLKILVGEEKEDGGEYASKRGLNIGYVPQISEFPDKPVETILEEALKESSQTEELEPQVLVSIWLSKLGFKGNEPNASKLSGGWKKRLSFALALIKNPDVLLLDEPTNHLDLEGILWLEKFLNKEAGTYLLVSHDRFFLQNVTNRIVEIDSVYPKGCFSIDGSYKFFLEKKEEFLLGQLEQQRSLASKARKELDWLRQSPKARTTKSRSRIEDAEELFSELSDVKSRNKAKKADIVFTASERETRKLLVAKNISKEIAGRVLFKHLEFTLSPGTRIGLMGPNGSGKTTLLKILAGELSIDQGNIKRADQLKIVYFDQHRNKLNPKTTLREALSPRGDYVEYQGHSIHVNGWCKRFLFSPDSLDMPIEKLSGGERARIAIAHLILQPADILLLDEPTNDLDIPTLETLEECLVEFAGAVVLITHDRCMLDRICNLFLALGDPEKAELYSDYSQWEASLKTQNKSKEIKNEQPKEIPSKSSSSKSKLSYNEKREYDMMDGKINELEKKIQELNHALERDEISKNPEKLQEICTQISILETQVEQAYIRFDELDKKLK